MAATPPLALDMSTLEQVVLRPGPEFTEDDFFEFCQEHSLLRIERNSEGEVIIMAPAGFESGFIELEIAAQLREWAKKDGRGMVAGATAGITLPDTSVFSPDACWIPMDRWEAISRKQRQRFPRLVPAFVIEIRSPSDRKKDLEQKMQTHLRKKVELAWLIDRER
jgi:Uma2 family endonuclease